MTVHTFVYPSNQNHKTFSRFLKGISQHVLKGLNRNGSGASLLKMDHLQTNCNYVCNFRIFRTSLTRWKFNYFIRDSSEGTLFYVGNKKIFFLFDVGVWGDGDRDRRKVYFREKIGCTPNYFFKKLGITNFFGGGRLGRCNLFPEK